MYLRNRKINLLQEKRNYPISAWNNETMMSINQCISWTQNSQQSDPHAMLLKATESLSKINRLKTRAIVAAVEMKDSTHVGTTTIWEVSLENSRVYVNNLFVGVI